MLAKEFRFHRRNHVNAVYKKGQQVRSGGLSLLFVRRQSEQKPRFAVVVSKKTAKTAVMRNRIRRRLFELSRTHLDQIQAGFDGVFTVHDKQVAKQDAQELLRDFEKLLAKAENKLQK